MTERVITLFEHETRPFAWNDRQLALLERLRAATGEDVIRATVRRGERALQSAHYVGVVRMDDVTIQILPKIYRNDEATSDRQRSQAATRNLLHLLAYADQLEIRESAVASLLQRDSNWFEILTYLFASHLAQEWQRGAFRTYQRVEEELPVLKGTWQLTQQLRRPERCHIFAVAYDEFSADNQLNRVFRYVVERLWQFTRDVTNRRLLGDLRQWMEDVTLLSAVRAVDAAPALLTRLNRRYEPLLNLARLFLANDALQLANGGATSYAFVFDMNLMFEGFVVNFIRRHRDEILPAQLQVCTLLPQARGAAYHLARAGSQAVFRLEPDLAFQQQKSFPLLIDTKYKRLDPGTGSYGISQADFYQMHAYATRYSCPRVILLYPQTADSQAALERTFHLEHARTTSIVAATVDIRDDMHRPAARRALIDRLRALIDGVQP